MKHKRVLKARDRLVQQLPPPAEILRGSLLRRTIRHRRGCPKCDRGGGHTAWVLSVSYPGGKNRQFSIGAEQREQVQQWVKNYQGWKAGLEAICELNHQLVRPERRRQRGEQGGKGKTKERRARD